MPYWIIYLKNMETVLSDREEKGKRVFHLCDDMADLSEKRKA